MHQYSIIVRAQDHASSLTIRWWRAESRLLEVLVAEDMNILDKVRVNEHVAKHIIHNLPTTFLQIIAQVVQDLRGDLDVCAWPATVQAHAHSS